MKPAQRLKAWIAPADYDVTDKSGLMEVDIDDFTVEHEFEGVRSYIGSTSRFARSHLPPKATIVGRMVANYPKKTEEPIPVSREETTMSTYGNGTHSNTISKTNNTGGVQITDAAGQTIVGIERDCDRGSRSSFVLENDTYGYIGQDQAVLLAAELVANSQGRENVNVEYGTNIGVHGTSTDTTTHAVGSGSAIARVYEPTSDDQAQRNLNFALANLNAYKAWVEGKAEREEQAETEAKAKAEREASERALVAELERKKAIDAKLVAVFRKVNPNHAIRKSDASILTAYPNSISQIRQTLEAVDAL